MKPFIGVETHNSKGTKILSNFLYLYKIIIKMRAISISFELKNKNNDVST